MSDARSDDSRSAPSGVAAAPSWVTPELIEHTIRIWQPFYAAPLDHDDAVAMILSVGRLFDGLRRE